MTYYMAPDNQKQLVNTPVNDFQFTKDKNSGNLSCPQPSNMESPFHCALIFSSKLFPSLSFEFHQDMKNC